MSKYELQLEELMKKWDLEYKKFEEAKQVATNNSMQYCYKFNSQITIVNVERHLMRKEINTLYKFLRQFGEIGDKLTPFDFVAEEWLFPGSSNRTQAMNSNTHKSRNPFAFTEKNNTDFVKIGTASAGLAGATAVTGVLGAATAMGTASTVAGLATIGTTVGLAMPVFVPLALPAYMFVGLKKRSDLKEELLQQQINYDKDCVKWKNELAKAQDETAYFAMAVEIANMYRVVVATIRDAIADKIIPELNNIVAFLYADSIKNCIINNEDPSNIRLSNISEYRGTPYERHYNFVKNTFEYYQLISEFFTQPVLTNMLNNGKGQIGDKEYKAFQKQIYTIGEKQVQVLDHTSVGGEK